MFDNRIHPIHYQKDVSNTNHSIYDIKYDQTLVLFIGFFVLLAYLIFYDTIRDTCNIFSKHSIRKRRHEIEGMHNFYHCISNKNLIHTIEEEKYIREKYAKKKLFDSTYENLIHEYEQRINGKEMVDDKILYGLSSFQFTAQLEYCIKIFYTPV